MGRPQVWAADHLSPCEALDVGEDGATGTSLSTGNMDGRIAVAEKTTFSRQMQYLPPPEKMCWGSTRKGAGVLTEAGEDRGAHVAALPGSPSLHRSLR